MQKSGKRRSQNPRRSAKEKARRSRHFAEQQRRQQCRRAAEGEASGQHDRRDPLYQLQRMGFLEMPRVCPNCSGCLKRQTSAARASTLYRCSNHHCRRRLNLHELCPMLRKGSKTAIKADPAVVLKVVQLYFAGQIAPPSLSSISTRLSASGTVGLLREETSQVDTGGRLNGWAPKQARTTLPHEAPSGTKKKKKRKQKKT